MNEPVSKLTAVVARNQDGPEYGYDDAHTKSVVVFVPDDIWCTIQHLRQVMMDLPVSGDGHLSFSLGKVAVSEDVRSVFDVLSALDDNYRELAIQLDEKSTTELDLDEYELRVWISSEGNVIRLYVSDSDFNEYDIPSWFVCSALESGGEHGSTVHSGVPAQTGLLRCDG